MADIGLILYGDLLRKRATQGTWVARQLGGWTDARAIEEQRNAVLRPLTTADGQLRELVQRQLNATARSLEHAVDRLQQRLISDTPDLERAWGLTVTPVAADLLVGDPHACGDGTTRLVLANGKECYYKPRPASAHRLLWLVANEVDPELGKQVVDILDRGPYSWTLGVARSIDLRADALWRYGRLAGLMTFFCVSDGHRENVISGTEGPVLIDAETAFQPGWMNSSWESDGVHDFDLHATGLLARQGTRGVGALDTGSSYLPIPLAKWAWIGNRAELHRSLDEPGRSGSRRRELFNMYPNGRLNADFVGGFNEVTQSVLDAGGRLSPLLDHASLSIRCVVRPTLTYMKAAERARVRAGFFLGAATAPSPLSPDLSEDIVGRFPGLPEHELQHIRNGWVPTFAAANDARAREQALESGSLVADHRQWARRFSTFVRRT